MQVKIISSQQYLNDKIIQEKIENEEYTVTLSPIFTIDGQQYQVVLDGHHRLAAAKEMGVEPEFRIAEDIENDTLGMIDDNIEDFLTINYNDCDWYDISTGNQIW